MLRACSIGKDRYLHLHVVPAQIDTTKNTKNATHIKTKSSKPKEELKIP